MVASRVIPAAMRAAPSATLAVLAAWTVLDIAAIRDGRWSTSLLVFLGIGVGLFALATAFRLRSVRPIGIVLIGVAYLSVHVFVLGIQVIPALVFVAGLICAVELRVLAERFAPLYEASLGPAEASRIRGALARALLRLGLAASLAVLVPILAADLAVAGVVPLTTIPTAILLAVALVLVIVVLALLPNLQRRAT